MTALVRFDACLAQAVSTDHWYDVADESARARLLELDGDDWQRLAAIWPLRPPVWQARLLLALRAAPQRSAPLLRGLVPACAVEDLDTAIDTLYLLPDDALLAALDDRGRARLVGHAARTTLAETLATLLERHARASGHAVSG